MSDLTLSANIDGFLAETSALHIANGISDATSVLSIDTNNRQLIGTDGIPRAGWNSSGLNFGWDGSAYFYHTLDWDGISTPEGLVFDLSNKQLKSSGIPSLDWANRQLITSDVYGGTRTMLDWTDPSGFGKIDLLGNYLSNIYSLADSSDYPSVFVNGRYLVDSSNYSSLDWATRSLYDGSGYYSVDWTSRYLYDSTGYITSVDWNYRSLYDGIGYYSVDWNYRYLYDYNGYTSVDWNHRTLNDSNSYQSVDWTSRYLYDSTGYNSSVDWGGRFLYDYTGSAIADWSNGTGLGFIVSTSLDSTNYTSYGSSAQFPFGATLTPTVVSSLTGNEGTIAYVNDADTPVTHGQPVVGGGAEKALVCFNGTDWIIVSHLS